MRRWLFADWGLKLGAVLLGGGLWLYAISGHSFHRELDIPLVVADPANPTGGFPIVLASPPPSTVRVVVKGVGMDLLRTSASDLELRVAPKSRGPGTLPVRLREDQVVVDSEYDIGVERVVEPRVLSLQVDRRAERSFAPVRPQVDLRVADAYTRRSRRRPSGLPGFRAHGGPCRVQIPEVPVAVRGGPAGAAVSPPRVTVRVRGGADLIGALETDSLLEQELTADVDRMVAVRPPPDTMIRLIRRRVRRGEDHRRRAWRRWPSTRSRRCPSPSGRGG